VGKYFGGNWPLMSLSLHFLIKAMTPTGCLHLMARDAPFPLRYLHHHRVVESGFGNTIDQWQWMRQSTVLVDVGAAFLFAHASQLYFHLFFVN